MLLDMRQRNLQTYNNRCRKISDGSKMDKECIVLSYGNASLLYYAKEQHKEKFQLPDLLGWKGPAIYSQLCFFY